MPVIGITGGVATGKSAVTRLFQQRGATVFSADEAARAVLTPDGPVLKEIVVAFGSAILTPEGTLDRRKLGALIFNDPAARVRLNAITHPPIVRLLRAQITGACEDMPPGSIVAVEVPLLYETGMESLFDSVLVVSASEAAQVERLRARSGLSASEARRRIESQIPLAEKRARADCVLANDGSLFDLEQALNACWPRLCRTPA